jgi:Flp pilus assembly protein TadB
MNNTYITFFLFLMTTWLLVASLIQIVSSFYLKTVQKTSAALSCAGLLILLQQLLGFSAFIGLLASQGNLLWLILLAIIVTVASYASGVALLKFFMRTRDNGKLTKKKALIMAILLSVIGGVIGITLRFFQ